MTKKTAFLLHVVIIIGLMLSACGTTPAPQPDNSGNGQTLKQAEVVFKVWIPENTPADAVVNLDILDEVTGLAIYPIRYSVTQSNSFLYEVHVPINIGSVVKYRYSKLSSVSIGESNSSGKAVRYRMVSIGGPAIVEDVIYAWGDLPLSKPTGRIQGRIIDETTNQPVSNILVSAGGISTFTSAEGDYILEGLPIGTHNLVAYSINGKYSLYQQGAMVAEGTTTPANLKIRPADQVTVTFITNTPVDASSGLPIRIAGNLYQLGNTYADISAGFSTVENRIPIMTVRDDGSYGYTIKLPAGYDLRYKYTLGDGFWNAEHFNDGSFRLRQLIVPANDIVVNDVIDSWSINKTTPYVFRVTAPESTPAGDSVSVQFNPFAWTPPLEMWALGNHEYIYVLYSPYQLMGDISYRYCRNDQCDKSVGILADKSAEQMVLTKSSEQKDITEVITGWTNFQTQEATPIVGIDIIPRVQGFITGFEFDNTYTPADQAHYIDALSSIYHSHANLLMLTPTWTVTHTTPPIFEALPGQDMLFSDLEQIAGWIKDTGVPMAIFPKLEPSGTYKDMDQWWMDAERSDGWWQSWFDRYHTFIMNYAIQAAQLQSSVLVLNDGNINPALPAGKLLDADPSGVPGDALIRWQRLIQDIRSVYGGEIYWVVYSDTDIENLTELINLVDKVVYAEFDSSLISSQDLPGSLKTYFEEIIYPVYEITSKPVIVGITFGQDITPEKQTTLYQAVLEEINQQKWVAGVISRDFDPTIRLQNNSNSIFGKPSMDLLQYWYPKLIE